MFSWLDVVGAVGTFRGLELVERIKARVVEPKLEEDATIDYPMANTKCVPGPGVGVVRVGV